MKAAFLLKQAMELRRVTQSLAIGAPANLDRPSRQMLCVAARLLSTRVAALPARGKHRDTAIEAAAELDAMLSGFDSLQKHSENAKRLDIATRMRLRALILARTADISAGVLVAALSSLANDGLDTPPCPRA